MGQLQFLVFLVPKLATSGQGLYIRHTRIYRPCSVTYIATSFIIYSVEQAKSVGSGKVWLKLTLEQEKLLSIKLTNGDFIHADVR